MKKTFQEILVDHENFHGHKKSAKEILEKSKYQFELDSGMMLVLKMDDEQEPYFELSERPNEGAMLYLYEDDCKQLRDLFVDMFKEDK